MSTWRWQGVEIRGSLKVVENWKGLLSSVYREGEQGKTGACGWKAWSLDLR